MRNFAHYDARSISEAVSLLAKHKGRAKLNAGGTDLLSILKDDILPEPPDAIVNIKNIRDLNYIKEGAGVVRIGCLARLSDVGRSPVVTDKFPLLAEAALAVGNPQIRKMGTLGGNLCQDVRCWYYRYPRGMGGSILCARKGKGPCLAVKGDNRYHAIMNGKKCFAVCSSDMAVALTALDARIVIAGTKRGRTIAISDFFNSVSNGLGTDEMVKEVEIPIRTMKRHQTFLKFTLRKSIDFAIVSVATVMTLDQNVCTDARIVLGAVAPGPARAEAAEKVLIGQTISADVAAKAAEAALAGAKPLSKNAYKMEIAKTLVKRAILGNPENLRQVRIVKTDKEYRTTRKAGKYFKAPTRGRATESETVHLIVNGKLYELMVGKDIATSHTLAHTLRETLGLTGTKIACDHGSCCSCTVLVDGEPTLSCMTLTIECNEKHIVTIEGLKDQQTGELNRLQQSFISHSAFQCGFCTPGIIMTAQALLDKTPDPAEDEIREALAGHFCRCISHYEVIGAVRDAAKERMEPPVSNGYRHIGKGTPRGDAVEIVSGTAAFISDLQMPGMLYGKILKSPYPHANVVDIDTTRAEQLSGVKAVLTYKNAPDWQPGNPKRILVLEQRVRFVGDAVALVAAETEEIAEEALKLIKVKYEQLPAVFDVEEAMKPDAPQLYTQHPGNLAPRGYIEFGPNSLQELVRGDISTGFEEADFIAEGTCGYEGMPNALTAEPPGAIAKWEGPDKVTIWSATPSPSLVRKRILAALGDVDVRSIASQCGGSFGSKNFARKPILYAVALAQVVGNGRPVRVAYTREEHLATYVVRFGSRIHGKVGIKKDGKVTAFSGEWFINTGNFAGTTQGQVAVGLGEVQIMLRCANWKLQPYAVFTNQTASGAVRGYGGQELKSAFLPILMLALEKADLDPVNFFRDNFARGGDAYYWRDGNLWTCRGVDYRKAAEEGARVFGWAEKWKGWLKPTAIDGPKRRGIGCGVHGNADVGEDRSEAYVRLLPNGRAVLHACVGEAGGGQRSSVRKMVAEVLNLPLDRVMVTAPDTLINPFDHGLAGSRGTYATGSAVTIAAMDARRKLFGKAAVILNARVEDLETRDGIVFVKARPDITVPWHTVIEGAEHTITGFGAFESDYSMPNFMMTFVEVEVDVETGMVELLKVTSATDVGRIIDPLRLEGQLHGALGAAGIDTALSEETILDKMTGRILNANMIDYKWRTFVDLPEFRNVILETVLPTHIYGALGVGEISTAAGPSAVLMAVSNAIGKRMTEYPLTPDKILRALGAG